MGKLDFRQIILQFRLQRPPNTIEKRLDPETREAREKRLMRSTSPSGVKIVESTEKCYVGDFLKEIEAEGYKLTDSFFQERVDDKVPYGTRKTYYMVRFIFTHKDFMEPLSTREDLRCAVALNDLSLVCERALWQVKIFSNPSPNDPSQRVMSINLNKRLPIYHDNGQPIIVWNGKISFRPAEHYLHVSGDTVAPIKV